MYVSAIVLAAGRGLRVKSKVSKPLIKINSKPLIIYSLNTLSVHPYIRDIIIVANAKNLKNIIAKSAQYKIGKIKNIVLGGRLRQDSVFKGLLAMDRKTDLVLIHDSVRPFIDRDIVSSVILAAKIYGAATAGVPLKSTIKSVKGPKYQSVKGRFIVEKTLNRKNLWEIQTPQVFKKNLILRAYQRFGNLEVYDDAMLVEKLGRKVVVVKGTYNNIKITTPEDLILAEAIAKNYR